MDDDEVAIEYLSKLTDNTDHLFYDLSYWYLALVYLKIGEIDKSKEITNFIIENRLTYADQAMMLKKEIKKIN